MGVKGSIGESRISKKNVSEVVRIAVSRLAGFLRLRCNIVVNLFAWKIDFAKAEEIL